MIHSLVMRKPNPRSLLHRISVDYAAELPILRHSMTLTDEGGAPEMTGPAKSWLGLSGRPDWCKNPATRAERRIHAECASGCLIEPDRPRRAAYRVSEGIYVTPTIRAIEEISDPTYRLYIKWTVSNALVPSDIARLFDIPPWCEDLVLAHGLEWVKANYRTAPAPDTRGRSDAQLDAEAA